MSLALATTPRLLLSARTRDALGARVQALGVEAVTLEDATRTAKRLYGEGKLLVAVVGQPVGL